MTPRKRQIRRRCLDLLAGTDAEWFERQQAAGWLWVHDPAFRETWDSFLALADDRGGTVADRMAILDYLSHRSPGDIHDKWITDRMAALSAQIVREAQWPM